jgi:histidinol-phosphate phosphatase family protein
MRRPFVVFDRDGTIIEHVHYLADPELVIFKPDLINSLEKLTRGGLSLGIVTNQSAIGRGLATSEQVNQVNDKIRDYLKMSGLKFDFILVCPHKPDDFCECRKPNIELGNLAIEEFGLDPSSSYFVGDQESDVLFGNQLGIKTVQVKGNANPSPLADYHTDNLNLAAEWILSDFITREQKCQ